MNIHNYQNALPQPGVFLSHEIDNTLLWKASLAFSTHKQLPMEAVNVTILSVISILAQGIYDVEIPNGERSPISNNTMIIMPSGGGKSATLNPILAPILKLQEETQERVKKMQDDYLCDIEAWNIEKEILRKKMRVALEEGCDVKTEKRNLRKHNARKPEAPKEFRMVYENTTMDALFQGLQWFPSAAIVTDEGISHLKGYASRDKGALNNAWDGKGAIINRVSRPSIHLDSNTRVSQLILIQPEPLMENIKSSDRTTGLLARFIVCNIQDNSFPVFYTPSKPNDDESIIAMHNRLKSLTAQNLQLFYSKNFAKTILRFTPEAQAHWYILANEIEQQKMQGGRFEHCKDHAAKLCKIICRTAASIHIFEEYEGDISLNTLRFAIDIICHFSTHFQTVFMAPPQDIQDAQRLMEWVNHQRRFHIRYIDYNHIRQAGPNCIRDKQRLRDAMLLLDSYGEVRVLMNGKKKIVDLMPALGQMQTW